MKYYLKYQKKLIELNEKEAERIGKLIDFNKKIPFGVERLDPMKCEILKDLPFNYQDYELIEQEAKLPAPQSDHSYQHRQWQEEQERIRKYPPEKKAEMELNSVVINYYQLRNGFDKEPNEQRMELIKNRLIKFFTDNPKATGAGLEIYEELLPPKQPAKAKDGWAKVGDILQV